jgi:serine protease
MRTGLTYPAWMDSAPSGAVPVCRFYGTPGVGPNSHFYTIVPAECAQVQKDPGWTLETTQAFYVVPPIGATCPGGTTPVYRAYNNRAAYNDSNHRYTADLAEFNNMLSIGWTGEGIAWCAPQ